MAKSKVQFQQGYSLRRFSRTMALRLSAKTSCSLGVFLTAASGIRNLKKALRSALPD